VVLRRAWNALAISSALGLHDILEETEPDRRLYLAIPHEVLDDLFNEPIGQLLLRRGRVRLIVFEPEQGKIVQWIPT
jgi:hypothetical protein